MFWVWETNNPAPCETVANMAHLRQSRPDSGLGFEVHALSPLNLFPLRSGGPARMQKGVWRERRTAGRPPGPDPKASAHTWRRLAASCSASSRNAAMIISHFFNPEPSLEDSMSVTANLDRPSNPKTRRPLRQNLGVSSGTGRPHPSPQALTPKVVLAPGGASQPPARRVLARRGHACLPKLSTLSPHSRATKPPTQKIFVSANLESARSLLLGELARRGHGYLHLLNVLLLDKGWSGLKHRNVSNFGV